MRRATETDAAVYIRKSVLAQYMDGFIDEKHANGFKYESEELILNRFDHYCNARGLSDAKVTKAFLDDWMTQTDTEGASYCAKRISAISSDHCRTYLIRRSLSPSLTSWIPISRQCWQDVP